MADLESQLSEWFGQAPDGVKQALEASLTSGADAESQSGQVTKAEANYRPSDGDDSCETCTHFDGASACSKVAGNIKPTHVSDLYEKAKDAHGPSNPDDTASPARDASSTAGGEPGGKRQEKAPPDAP